jgi:hypothetical protein
LKYVKQHAPLLTFTASEFVLFVRPLVPDEETSVSFSYRTR